jgi:hypothetical protein
MTPRAAALSLFGLAVLLSASCATRTHRETVFNEDLTEVLLRSQTRGGDPVARGFEHPVIISAARVANILSRIDIRYEAKKGSERSPAIPVETIYRIAAGVSQALAKAKPSQEVVVLSVKKSKSLGIFDRRHLTSFVTYLDDDLLHIHLCHVDYEIDVREKKIPEPKIGKHVMKFRAMPSENMTLVDHQSLAVSWRNPVFKKATRLRTLPGGRVVRREILMESPEEEPAAPPPIPDRLSPTALRRLAELEEQRRSGEISESEYATRRNAVLRADGAAGP